jgi:triacylglycerol esterase/lipase EstA (alpha/beta hydrolase family)
MRVVLRMLAAVALVAIATSAHAKTGVVFIHGKGGTDLASNSVARAYWTEDMIRATTKGYTVPHLITNYDGTRYMWVAGDVVAGQIYNWMMANAIDDIVVETHSFGGIVIRWIMSNPGYNPKYQPIINRIRWVNSIAPPNGGSEAANLAGTLSGSWLTGWLVSLVGQNNESTRNCQTSWMASYNQNYLKGTAGRPALPKTVYNIAGWGLWNDYYYRFHSEDFGLATLSGVAGLPGEDDGMVAEWSARLVGVNWFRTEANHHHNRRNDYKKIGDSLATDF